MYYTYALPLHEWRRRGSFLVSKCDKKIIVIEAASLEVGSTLLADAEYLLDHAAEQRATVRRCVTDSIWHSPAWASVTSYYWAFFCAMALTRLTGRSTWFLDKPAITELKILAGAVTQPGAGALLLSVGPYVSGTNRELTLRPSRSQLHDALWHCLDRLVADVFANADQQANPLEFRLWWCLHEANLRLGADWPSKLRNLVNYVPGRGYREVIRDSNIDVAQYLRRRSPLTLDGVISDFEDEVVKVKVGAPFADSIHVLCRMMALLGISLGTLVEELHFELIERGSSDRRWLNNRRRFLQLNCPGTGQYTAWPVNTAV